MEARRLRGGVAGSYAWIFKPHKPVASEPSKLSNPFESLQRMSGYNLRVEIIGVCERFFEQSGKTPQKGPFLGTFRTFHNNFTVAFNTTPQTITYTMHN